MDNAPIYTPVKVHELVEGRDYKCLYLPPYSPFLNPIEEFWSKVKAGVRRNALTADDRLSNRICESVQMVTRADCQAWIRHALSFFARCKQEDINLWEERKVDLKDQVDPQSVSKCVKDITSTKHLINGLINGSRSTVEMQKITSCTNLWARWSSCRSIDTLLHKSDLTVYVILKRYKTHYFCFQTCIKKIVCAAQIPNSRPF